MSKVFRKYTKMTNTFTAQGFFCFTVQYKLVLISQPMLIYYWFYVENVCTNKLIIIIKDNAQSAQDF